MDLSYIQKLVKNYELKLNKFNNLLDQEIEAAKADIINNFEYILYEKFVKLLSYNGDIISFNAYKYSTPELIFWINGSANRLLKFPSVKVNEVVTDELLNAFKTEAEKNGINTDDITRTSDHFIALTMNPTILNRLKNEFKIVINKLSKDYNCKSLNFLYDEKYEDLKISFQTSDIITTLENLKFKKLPYQKQLNFKLGSLNSDIFDKIKQELDLQTSQLKNEIKQKYCKSNDLLKFIDHYEEYANNNDICDRVKVKIEHVSDDFGFKFSNISYIKTIILNVPYLSINKKDYNLESIDPNMFSKILSYNCNYYVANDNNDKIFIVPPFKMLTNEIELIINILIESINNKHKKLKAEQVGVNEMLIKNFMIY